MADPHGKINEKLKSKNMQKSSFLLTTYLFIYTSECTISWSNFLNFLRLRWQGGIDPRNQNPADALAESTSKQSQVAPTYVLLFDLSHLFAVHTSLLLALLLFLFLSLFLLKSLLLHQLLDPAQHPPRLTARQTATTLPKAGQRLY